MIAHNISLITTITAGFGTALLLGFVAERIKLPALVGYLIAGILIGPATPGFVADANLASQLSEIGIMLMMFGVGLHFSIHDLLKVKHIAIPGAIVQMGLATLLGMLAANFWGWDWGSGFVFGLCLSCASTVVLIKALESRNAIQSMNGRIAIGWLVLEDLATVMVLVLLPPLAGILGGGLAEVSPSSSNIWLAISKTLLQVCAFVLIMLVAGYRVLPWLLWQVAKTGSRELFTLAVITCALGIAYGASALFNVSFALGAFFAGMVMRESEFSHRAAEETLPLRDAFSVLFFVSVGMLFQPSILIAEPTKVLSVIAIIVLGKSIAAASIVIAFRYPLNTALTVAASLAQIGEFSFILAGLGLSLGLINVEAMSLVLAGALISITLNPLLFYSIEPLRQWAIKRSSFARKLEQRQDPYAELPMSTDRKYLSGQVVVVGYGRVGRQIVSILSAHNIPFILAEQNRQLVETLRKNNMAAVSGDATDPVVLIQAHIHEAAMLVIATSSPVNLQHIIDTARSVNPNIRIFVRTDTEAAFDVMRHKTGVSAFLAEDELATNIANQVINAYKMK